MAATFVAVVFMITSLAVNDLDRSLDWDEATYLSEALPSIADVGFDAHRARGIVVVAYPFHLLDTTSIAPLRIWLVLVHSVGLGIVVEIWRRIVGAPVLASALIFASSWLALFYSAELSPNLLASLLLAAALGCTLLSVRNRGRVLWAVFAVLFLAAGAFVRPTDSLWYTVGVMATALITALPVLKVLLIAVAGLGLGWFPWVIEAELHFGGTFERLRKASELVSAGIGTSFKDHVLLLDGPLVGPQPSGGIPWFGVAWLAGLLVLSVTVLVRSWGGRARLETVVPAGAAVASAFPYVFLTGALAPRFLLPAYLALALVSGQAFGLKDRKGFVRLLVWAAAAVVAVASLWQITVAIDISSDQLERRQVALDLGLAIKDLSQGTSCVVASQYGYPQIQVYSECNGSRMTLVSPTLPEEVSAGLGEGMTAFVVFWSEAPKSSPVATWPRTIVETSFGGVYVYRFDAPG